jgi:hypothetical protein
MVLRCYCVRCRAPPSITEHINRANEIPYDTQKPSSILLLVFLLPSFPVSLSLYSVFTFHLLLLGYIEFDYAQLFDMWKH